MDRRPSSAGPSPARRVTLTLHGPIGELAAAPRTLADALDREQASGAVTYAAAVEADDSSPAPGGMTATLADRFVAQLSPAAVDVLALLCHNAPQLTYEDLQAQAQAQFDIGRAQIGGVLTSFAAGRKRLPREVYYPIKRDAQHRRYRIEPVAAELLLSAIDRARGTATPRGSSPARCGVQWLYLTLAVAGRETGNPVGNPVVVTVPAGMRPAGRRT